MNMTDVNPILSLNRLQLRCGKWSLTRPQPHGFAGESWVGAPPFLPPESAQGVLPVPLRLRLRHVPQNHVTQLLHQQRGVSTEPSSRNHHVADEMEVCFLKKKEKKKNLEKPVTHTHTQKHSVHTTPGVVSPSTQLTGCDCNYAIIMLMRS